MTRRFEARADGGMVVTLEAVEADLLGELPDQLRAVYEAGDDDPAHARLFPQAYLDPTEERAEREWRELVHPELLGDRVAALDRLRAVLGAGSPRGGTVRYQLDAEGVEALLGILNDARLALGTRLDVTEELDLSELDPRDPNAPLFAAYAWLTGLEAELVDVLLGE